MNRRLLLALLVLLGAMPAIGQYCTPTYSTTGIAAGALAQLTVLSGSSVLANDTIPSSALATGYVDRSAAVSAISMRQGSSYTFNLSYFSAEAHTGNMVWIDINNDGVFADSEAVSLVVPASGRYFLPDSAIDINVNIPLNCSAGTHKMRIRNVVYDLFTTTGVGSTLLDACNGADVWNSYLSGITADYNITVTAAPACSGTPVAGTISAPASVCSGQPFSMSLANDTIASGLSYQWYQVAGSAVAIAGATNRYYNSLGQSASTTYFVTATCSAGMSVNTPPRSVGINPFYTCYCSSALGGYPSALKLDSVAISGTSLSYNTSAFPSPYVSHPDTGMATTTLYQGHTYTLYIRSGGYQRYAAAMWLDLNNNGTYEVSEHFPVATSTVAGGSVACTFTIPLAADTGKAGMRIRLVNDASHLTGIDACTYFSSGQTQDFLVFINTPVNCTGLPGLTGINATVPSVCPGVPFLLSSATRHNVAGINWQWYQRPVGSTSFVSIGGAINPDIIIPNQTVATEYMLTATCAASGLSDSTTILSVNENPFYVCYCSPVNNTTLNVLSAGGLLDSAVISGTSFYSLITGDSSVYHSFYPFVSSTTATLQTGYPYSFTTHAISASGYGSEVWIDYDHNGTFDASEKQLIGAGISPGASATNMLSVPVAADTGYTGMRIRITASGSTTSDACTEQYYGTTNDYVVRIIPGAPCTGVPAAGYSVASDSLVCPTSTFVVGTTGALATTGITYQWLSKTMAGGYSVVAGATNLSYSITGQIDTTMYALRVTCTISGLSDTSIPVTVYQNATVLCACSPITGVILNDSVYAAPIDTFSILGTALNHGTASDRSPYILTTTSTVTANLLQGGSFVYEVNSSGTVDYKVALWIDLDHNSQYDTYEYFPVTVTGQPGRAVFGQIVLPTGGRTGATGLRLRTFPAGYTPTAADACAYSHLGTTHDYTVNIALPNPCAGLTGPTITSASFDSVCSAQQFQVFPTNLTSQSGLRFQWQQASASSSVYSAISGATNIVYNVPGQTSATLYRLTATCITAGATDSTGFTVVDMNPFYLCYCSPYTGTPLHATGTVSPDSVAVSLTALNNVSPRLPVYKQFYPLTSTNSDSLSRGRNYTLYVTSDNGPFNADVWLDMNQNGIFDATEYFHGGTMAAAGTVLPVSIFIPYSIPTGFTGLRIRVTGAYWPMTNTDACTYQYDGVTQDYIVRIAYGVPCTGTPAAGTASATVTTICAGSSFTLRDTGFTQGVGITYQWFSRPVGSSTFTAITGATDTSFTVASQTVATEYQLAVNCTSSSSTATSGIVTVLQTPHYACYCTGTLGSSASGTQIQNLQFHGSALHLHWPVAGAYRWFGMAGDSTGVIQRGYAYPVELKVSGGAAFNAGMWIDYNHSGSFENSEYIRLDTNAGSGTTSTTVFTVPAGADTGVTGVRIRTTTATSTFGAADACTYFANSQTYDLRMRIDTLVRCSGIPDAGTITSTSAYACPSMTFQLNNERYDVGVGLTYQWYRRTTGSFASITGATSYTTTITGQTQTTDYAVVATCTLSGRTDTSNILRITENPFDSCYCSPATGVPLVGTGGHHNILSLSLLGVTTMSVPEQYPDSTGYVAVPPTPSTFTTTLRRFSGYPLTVYVNTGYTISAAGGWIDYNHNSVFDSAEYIALTQSSDHSNWSATVNVPSTALIGLTGMRIITRESGAITASASCGPVLVGQVQDHIINIQPAPCYAVSSGSVSSITDSSAFATWARVPGSLGYQYVFDTVSTGPAGSGTYTTDTFTSSGCLVSGRHYYLHVKDSCDGGITSGWFTVSFFTAACAGPATVTASSITDRSATVSWSAVSGSMGYEYVLDTTSASPVAAGTYTTATTQAFSALTQGTTYYAHIRSGCHCSNQSAWQTITFTTICDTITHLSLVGFTDTSVTIKWDSIAGISTYAWVVNTTAGAPTTTGTVVHDTMITASGLTPGTSYYAHVRHNCTGGYSSWVTIPFTTSRCDTITGLVGIPNDTGIVIYWTGVTGATSYYWVVNTVAAPPIGTTGTMTTIPADTVGPLYSSTLYYVHVRTGCSGGSSGWVTIPVRTLDCDTVNSLVVSSICDTSAILSWAASAGGLGYAWAVTTSASAPTGPGTYSPVNIVVAGGLTAGTSYYAHVRHLCGTIDSSAWISTPFSTPVCTSVAGLGATAINTTGATISWTAITCITGYEYTIDNVPTDPTVAGTFYTTNSVTETTLMPGTTYYVHVRVVCGGGVFSGWVTYSFTTLNCPASSISVSGISSSYATVNWTPATGAVGYEYAVDNSAVPPAFGTYTTAISYFASALLPATNYYAHVRVLCGGGTYSAWNNEPFTTTNLGVAEVGDKSFRINAWPNPADDQIVIVADGATGEARVTITDPAGRFITAQLITDGRAVINVSQLAAGVYLLRYEDGIHSAVLKMNKQ